jgi:hypothetical protein
VSLDDFDSPASLESAADIKVRDCRPARFGEAMQVVLRRGDGELILSQSASPHINV